MQISDYLNAHLLSALQFAFCAGLSVADLFLFTYNYASYNCDAGFPADGLYFDFQEDFWCS